MNTIVELFYSKNVIHVRSNCLRKSNNYKEIKRFAGAESPSEREVMVFKRGQSSGKGGGRKREKL